MSDWQSTPQQIRPGSPRTKRHSKAEAAATTRPSTKVGAAGGLQQSEPFMLRLRRVMREVGVDLGKAQPIPKSSLDRAPVKFKRCVRRMREADGLLWDVWRAMNWIGFRVEGLVLEDGDAGDNQLELLWAITEAAFRDDEYRHTPAAEQERCFGERMNLQAKTRRMVERLAALLRSTAKWTESAGERLPGKRWKVEAQELKNQIWPLRSEASALLSLRHAPLELSGLTGLARALLPSMAGGPTSADCTIIRAGAVDALRRAAGLLEHELLLR